MNPWPETIVGGMFGLPKRTGSGPSRRPAARPVPEFLRGRSLRGFNARSCVYALLRALRPRPATVWLPAFLCHPLTDAVTRSGIRAAFYPVTERLELADLDWIRSARPGDLAVFVDYFGFPAPGTAMRAASARGIRVLRDACQSLLSEAEFAADFTVYSPRKFVGVPSSGILTFRDPRAFPDVRLRPAPRAARSAQSRAFFRRSLFDRDGRTAWFADYRRAQAQQPCGPFAADPAALGLLTDGSVDYASCAARRRQNYRALLKDLRDLALFPELPGGVVPLGFPVTLDRRDAVRKRLARDRVFCPVHWELPASVPRRERPARRLSGRILTLPCDQRYSEDDMRRLAARVRQAS